MYITGEKTITKNINALAEMLEKLNTTQNIYSVLPEVLHDLCKYLNFGCGFYYQANHEKLFTLKEESSFYDKHGLPESLRFDEILNKEDLESLQESKMIFYRDGESKTKDNIGLELSNFFQVKSLLIVFIFDENNEISGFVGLSDRRGLARTEADDMTMAYTIISTICNYLKLELTKERLDATKNALQSVTDNMGVDIYVNDFYTHEVLYANSSMAKPYGGVENMIGETCWKVLYDDKDGQCEYCPQKQIIDEEGNPTKVYTWDYQRPFDGKWFKVISAAFQWIDGRLAHIVSSIDITESKQNEQIIQKMALFDHLTGLPNRYNLTEDLDEMIPTMEATNSEGYVIFFDLDGFKQINDKLGHQVGDDLLKEIGRLLRENKYIGDRCYRYGGDEFVILCYGNNTKDLNHILDFLEKTFTNPIEVDGQELKCGASIGISHYPYDDKKTSGLVRKADQAMYVSKNNKKSMVHFYNEDNICTHDEYVMKYLNR